MPIAGCGWETEREGLCVYRPYFLSVSPSVMCFDLPEIEACEPFIIHYYKHRLCRRGSFTLEMGRGGWFGKNYPVWPTLAIRQISIDNGKSIGRPKSPRPRNSIVKLCTIADYNTLSYIHLFQLFNPLSFDAHSFYHWFSLYFPVEIIALGLKKLRTVKVTKTSQWHRHVLYHCSLFYRTVTVVWTIDGWLFVWLIVLPTTYSAITN